MKKFKKVVAMCLTAAMALSAMCVGVSAAEVEKIKPIGTNQVVATSLEGDIFAEMERLGLSVPQGVVPEEVGILPNTGLAYVIGSFENATKMSAFKVEDVVEPRSDSWTQNVSIRPYVEGETGTVIRTFTTYPGTTARLSWYGFTDATSLNIGIRNNVTGWDDYVMGLSANKYWGLSGADPSHTYTWRGSVNGTSNANNIRFTNVAPY